MDGAELYGETLQTLNQIFVQSPGDALYFLIVITVILAAFGMSLALRSAHEQQSLRRYPLAFTGVLFAWALMLAGAVFVQVSGQPPDRIYPPLERAIMTASLLLVGWAFLTADHAYWRQVSSIVLLLLLAPVAAGYTLTGANWINLASNSDFNLTTYGLAWVVIPLMLSLLGVLLSILLIRQVVDAPLKLLFFLLNALGSGLALLQMMNGTLIGDYAGLTRLGFVLSLLVVPLVLYRIMLRDYRTILSSPRPPLTTVPAASEERRLSTVSASPLDQHSVQLLKSLGLILEAAAPQSIPAKIVTTALEMLHADVGALLRLQDANYADITTAQDHLMQRQPSGMSLNLDQQPTLVNAIERQSQRVLYGDRNRDELDDLYTRLDVDRIGPAYFQPLVHHQETIAVLVIAFPYTGRELRPDEVELLKGLGIIASSLLMLSDEAEEARAMAEYRAIQAMVEGVPLSDLQESEVLSARKEMQASLQLAREQIAQLNEQVRSLTLELDAERSRLLGLLGGDADLSVSQQIVAVNEEREQLREERERLATRLQEAEAALYGATAADNETVTRELIASLQKERESLETEKARLQSQLDDLRAQDKALVSEDMQKLLSQMVDEKSLLEHERDQLRDKLAGIQSQLQALGIEDGTTGLSQLISQLFEERASLKEKNELLRQERDVLLKERASLTENLEREKDRDAQLQSLQSQIEHLASDREAITKQRDKLRSTLQETVEKLNQVKANRAYLRAQTESYEMELTELREEQRRLHTRLERASEEQARLNTSHDQLIAENRVLQTERDQLIARLDGNVSRLQEVNQEGVGSLQQMIEDLTQERDRLKGELQAALATVTRSETDASPSDAEDIVTALRSAGDYEPQNPELLVGLVEEFRTPMTSISGYVDLLLAESAGILGEMQRKFLQRVSANIARLDSMIESLIRITKLDTGLYQPHAQMINMVSLVEDAITNSVAQFREKGLTIAFDLDDELPALPADPDAMNQLVAQLLSNAYLVSPPNSEITITLEQRPVRFAEGEAPQDSLYMAVEDRGGGIDPEDIARVFARKYRADNPLIEGLGDTGVGMSIARALVEAHQGTMWVETKAGVGSRFAFAIPLNVTLETGEQ